MTPEQIKMLNAPLNPASVKPADASKGIKGDYIEGWHCVAELNRIFGFDGWSYTIDLSRDDLREGVDRNGKPQWQAAYTCICTLRVGEVVRQDVGFGSGFGKNIGDAIEGATKEAVTDALKRAARTFGNPFGLALYDKSRSNVGFAMIDSAQISDLQGMIEGFGLNLGKILAHYKIKQLTHIPAEEFANVKRQLNLWNDMKIKQESEKA